MTMDGRPLRAHRVKVVALALLAPMLLACSSTPPDAIMIGSAPATPTGNVSLARPLDSSGFFAFSSWPSACDLLTDQDVRSMFPQARAIRRKPGDQKLKILPNLLGRPTGTRDVTVKNASCRVAFSLPGVELDDEFPDTSGYQLTVNVDAAGTAEVVRENFGTDKNAPTLSVGGAECRIRTNNFTCMKGQVAFSVSLNPSGISQGKFDGKLRLRYQVGTEMMIFDRSTDAQERGAEKGITEAIWKFENEHVSPELVKAITAKI